MIDPPRKASPSRWRELGLTPALVVFVTALVALPFVLYFSLRHHAELESMRDARAFSSVISVVRSYYAANVSGRILQNNGVVTVTDHYHKVPGGVPIPATLSIELGEAIRDKAVDTSLLFSFVSDLPFKQRDRPALDTFQAEALQAFRRDEQQADYWRSELDPAGVPRMRLAIPVRMEAGCVNCHNTHPDSPARDWSVGDVRGIQDVSVALSLTGQAEDSMPLVIYLLFFTGSALAALREYRKGNSLLKQLNEDREHTSSELYDKSLQLQQTVEELRTKTTVLDKAPFGIVIAQPRTDDLEISYVNEAFVQLTDYAHDEVVGRCLRFLYGPDTQTDAIVAVHEAIQQKQTLEIEILNYRRDGSTFWSRFLAFPSYDTQNRLQHYVVCITNITDLKNAENERIRLAGELQESLKLESLGLTIAGIAHDLNTPIGIAITASSHLDKVAQQLDDAAHQGDVAASEAGRLASLVGRSVKLVLNNLTKAAKLVTSFKQTTADATRIEWRKVNLNTFLESLVVSVSPLMKRGRCEVRLNCPADISLRTEPGSLGQAVTNLMVNASIHAFEGREDRVVCIEVSRQEGLVRITVADNGNGMNDEAAAKAFTPFFTTKRGSGGSGLGLFSSRRTVEQVLGGKLTFHSTPGTGTTFHIDLPISTSV
ncbi:MAG: hypothetical protein RJA34_598 [Pseudomonadota bacterium]|jgi:PAS domain S-box-containing protein